MWIINMLGERRCLVFSSMVSMFVLVTYGCSRDRQYAEANEHAVDSRDFVAIYSRGKRELKERKFSRALVHFFRASKLRPEHVGSQVLLAVTYISLGDEEQGRLILQPLMRDRAQIPVAPRRLLLGQYAHLCTNAEEYNLAISFLNEASGLGEDSSLVHAGLANAYLGKGDLDKAYLHAKKAVDLHDSDTHRAALAKVVLEKEGIKAAKLILNSMRSEAISVSDPRLMPIIWETSFKDELSPDARIFLKDVVENCVIIRTIEANPEALRNEIKTIDETHDVHKVKKVVQEDNVEKIIK